MDRRLNVSSECHRYYVPLHACCPFQGTRLVSSQLHHVRCSGMNYSRIYLATSENFYEKTLLEVREAIVKLYSLVATLNEGISILEDTLDNFKKDLNEVTELYKNGFQEEENVEQIKITLALY